MVVVYLFAAFAAGFFLQDDWQRARPAVVTAPQTAPQPAPSPSLPSLAANETYECRWRARGSSYTVSIRVGGSRAFRDDGGRAYTVVSNSDDLLVLLVNRPRTAPFAFQTIDKNTGAWSDYVESNGRMRQVRGGSCQLN
ncbi:MAG: hypothetical protein AAGF19_09040 [Pseudomonadota bacterium]